MDVRLQCHVIEDGILRLSHITVGENCTIGVRTTLLAGTTLEPDATVESVTMLPENSHLRSGEVFRGSPGLRVTASDLPFADVPAKSTSVYGGVVPFLQVVFICIIIFCR